MAKCYKTDITKHKGEERMKNLKVGDYVRIRADLESNECGISEDTLSKYKGEITKITKVSDSTTFKVDVDNGSYIWDRSWFEDKDIEIKPKSHYEVGDYVRIRSDLKQMYDDEVDTNVGLEVEMIDYAGKLARITSVKDASYLIDIDDGNWFWEDMLFEYRLGNYEDNDFSNGEVYYTVGFKHMGSVHTFIGKLQKWSTDKCEFISKSGIILMVDYNNLEYVIPKENA